MTEGWVPEGWVPKGEVWEAASCCDAASTAAICSAVTRALSGRKGLTEQPASGVWAWLQESIGPPTSAAASSASAGITGDR